MKVKWCFELGRIVKVIEMEGTEPTDEFEIIDRKLEEDSVQYFMLKRTYDEKVWGDVPASLIL